MKTKFVLLFFLILLALPLISAAPPVSTQVFILNDGYEIQYPSITVLKQNAPYTFEFHVFNKSNGMPINHGLSCYFDLYNSSGDHQLFVNVSAVSHTWDYEVEIIGENFSKIGIYSYIMQCNSSNLGGVASLQFEVTTNGEILSDSQSNVLILNILIPLIFFIILVWLSVKLKGDDEDEHAGMRIAFFGFSFMVLAYVSYLGYLYASTYLNFDAFSSSTGMFMRVIMFFVITIWFYLFIHILKSLFEFLGNQRKQKLEGG